MYNELNAVTMIKVAENAGQEKGSKVKKSEYDLVTFGYKRSVTNK